LELVLLIQGDRSAEKKLHRKFRHIRHHAEWFEDDQQLRDYIKGFSPDILEKNRKLQEELEAKERQLGRVKHEIFIEIKEKVFGETVESPGKKAARKPEKAKRADDETWYFRTSVKGSKGKPTREVVRRLVVDENIWAFSEGVAHRKNIRPGDYICFYAQKMGVLHTLE